MIGLTKKLIRNQTASLLKKNKSERSSIPFNKANSVGILATIDHYDKLKIVNDFIGKLEADGKNVDVLFYERRKDKPKDYSYHAFSEDEIGFRGGFNNEYIHHFAKTPYDYLFHLDSTEDIVLNKILAMSQARCRVGPSGDDRANYYELMFAAEDTDSLSKSIFQYITNVRENT